MLIFPLQNKDKIVAIRSGFQCFVAYTQLQRACASMRVRHFDDADVWLDGA